jgi:uncharacterized membrane protein
VSSYKNTVNTAFACALVLGVVQATQAADANKEKCFGIAKSGQNDCANLAGSHFCAGQSKLDSDAGEWKFVPKGQCKYLGGLTIVEAKANFSRQKR